MPPLSANQLAAKVMQVREPFSKQRSEKRLYLRNHDGVQKDNRGADFELMRIFRLFHGIFLNHKEFDKSPKDY